MIQTFHYALKPGGFLFLGPSEGVTRDTDLFNMFDKKHRILHRRDNGGSSVSGLRPFDAAAHTPPTQTHAALFDDGIDRSARRVIEPYSPVYFVIDRKHDIVRFSGADAGQLEPSGGPANLNLFSILRRTLRPARAAVLAAEAQRHGVVQDVTAPSPNGQTRALSLIVEPIEVGALVVALRELGSAAAPSGEGVVSDHERELRATKAQLNAAVSELDTYMEEAKSANEEMQSVNEELETSKEEMQSINEELQTLNAELQNTNTALSRINDDLQNLLHSTQVATLFLDTELRIRNFTLAMTAIFRVRDGDVGRPITDIVSRITYQDLVRDAEEVQRTLGVIERRCDSASVEKRCSCCASDRTARWTNVSTAWSSPSSTSQR